MPNQTNVSGLGKITNENKTHAKNNGATKAPNNLLKYLLYFVLSPLFVSIELIRQFVQIRTLTYASIGVALMMICISILLVKQQLIKSQTNKNKNND